MKVLALSPSIALAAFAVIQGALVPTNAFHAPRQRPNVNVAEYAPTSAAAHQKNRSDHRCRVVAFLPAERSAAGAATATALPSSAAGSDEDPYASPRLDADALAKYAASAATELALFGATFQLLDTALDQLGMKPPFAAAAFVFYAASLKSRVFNPLNNSRPDLSKAVGGGEGGAASPGFRDRVMPSWTPPGVLFPIMWILIIGPLRAYSSALVVSSTGAFFTLPTMAFVLHLTIGDIWNTINNAERRYGAAVVGVLCVVVSAANAAYQYSTVDPTAGELLGGTCLWLVTAAALIADTWRLNPAENGERVPLYPVKGEAETSFMWFNNEGE